MGNLWDRPYVDRTDEEKLQTQWIKANGLLQRRDWSAATVRIATAMEMSANITLSEVFVRAGRSRRNLKEALKWSLNGKLSEIEHHVGEHHRSRIQAVTPRVLATYRKRNRIVHQGEFCDPQETAEHTSTAMSLIQILMPIYRPTFTLSRDAAASEDDPGS
jgi:hypothetical protein